MTAAGRLAVVDIGSNSLRLFLCEGIGPEGPRGERDTTVIGLRRGAGPDGAIAADALARLDERLADYADASRPSRPRGTLAVATSAVRDAPNRDAVEAVVERRLGAPMRLLSGVEEAAALVRRRAAGGRRRRPDPGRRHRRRQHRAGARAAPPGPRTRSACSSASSARPSATSTTTRRSPRELEALREEARALVAAGPRGARRRLPAVAVAGTATSLAAIDLGGYDRDRVHRHRLTLATIDALAARLAGMAVDERRGVAGPRPGAGAGVIVAGALILAEAVRGAGAADVMVSETDLLDGVAIAAAGSPSVSLRL